ncbi:hypothetical protein DFP72DRAFT_1072430 [Ephemerocybe angulata]|uniref:Uncharacterized protein n=1 Tax=Ephemerocybe angulata TaxID=980116 RepID=A0A8H6M235_9AGAR|nr:hypothetical protein DFP72DRAFT_1072430 [Tulosesus angulatus]
MPLAASFRRMLHAPVRLFHCKISITHENSTQSAPPRPRIALKLTHSRQCTRERREDQDGRPRLEGSPPLTQPAALPPLRPNPSIRRSDASSASLHAIRRQPAPPFNASIVHSGVPPPLHDLNSTPPPRTRAPQTHRDCDGPPNPQSTCTSTWRKDPRCPSRRARKQAPSLYWTRLIDYENTRGSEIKDMLAPARAVHPTPPFHDGRSTNAVVAAPREFGLSDESTRHPVGISTKNCRPTNVKPSVECARERFCEIQVEIEGFVTSDICVLNASYGSARSFSKPRQAPFAARAHRRRRTPASQPRSPTTVPRALSAAKIQESVDEEAEPYPQVPVRLSHEHRDLHWYDDYESDTGQSTNESATIDKTHSQTTKPHAVPRPRTRRAANGKRTRNWIPGSSDSEESKPGQSKCTKATRHGKASKLGSTCDSSLRRFGASTTQNDGQPATPTKAGSSHVFRPPCDRRWTPGDGRRAHGCELGDVARLKGWRHSMKPTSNGKRLGAQQAAPYRAKKAIRGRAVSGPGFVEREDGWLWCKRVLGALDLYGDGEGQDRGQIEAGSGNGVQWERTAGYVGELQRPSTKATSNGRRLGAQQTGPSVQRKPFAGRRWDAPCLGRDLWSERRVIVGQASSLSAVENAFRARPGRSSFTGSGVLDLYGDGEGQDRGQIEAGSGNGVQWERTAGYVGAFLSQFDPSSLTNGVALDVYGADSDGEWRAWWNRARAVTRGP